MMRSTLLSPRPLRSPAPCFLVQFAKTECIWRSRTNFSVIVKQMEKKMLQKNGNISHSKRKSKKWKT